jgi:hypothetical protein
MYGDFTSPGVACFLQPNCISVWDEIQVGRPEVPPSGHNPRPTGAIKPEKDEDLLWRINKKVRAACEDIFKMK